LLPPLGTVIEAGRGGSFELGQARERLAAMQRHSRPIRWLANILFGYLFLVAPALIYLLGLRLTWIPLLAGMFLLTAWTGIVFRRAHRTLHGEAAADARFSAALTIGLSPANAIRAGDALSRRLFDEFHPLCLTRLLCGDAVFRTMAARGMARARYPTPAEGPITNSAQFEAFLRSEGLAPAELLAPPVEREPGSAAYCPRCRSLFVAPVGTCADCGVPLLPLPPPPNAAARGPR
jgi:hypothetical protein